MVFMGSTAVKLGSFVNMKFTLVLFTTALSMYTTTEVELMPAMLAEVVQLISLATMSERSLYTENAA